MKTGQPRAGSAAAVLLRGAAGIVAVGVLWELVVRVGGIKPYYLPSLSSILQAIAALPATYAGSFLRTLSETVLGYAAGAVVGVVNGVIFHRVRLLRELVFPLFIISQTIPVIAFGAVVVLWFGNTILAKALIAFYLTFFPVTVNTLQGLEAVDRRQLDLLRSFGATPLQLLLRLQLPAALPQIFVALRLACTLSLLGAIAGEWFGDTTGLGVLLLQAMYNEQFVALWAAILMAGILGTSFYGLVAWAEHKVVFWRAEL
ncbi:ABC transporter permease [Bordetella genomosp. 11]|uniref:ABC transporter permease n=1 Tax=Bordetella genomosp. 11 TaxID=1416808 RepID=A0A261UH03_9BORD|nr:ABC transporter permease [Bordetella genomosp. 11]OZI60692.1 ABC transporter permease [Bordetella genomosp. 11]